MWPGERDATESGQQDERGRNERWPAAGTLGGDAPDQSERRRSAAHTGATRARQSAPESRRLPGMSEMPRPGDIHPG